MRSALGLITSVMLAALVTLGVLAGQTSAPPGDPTRGLDPVPVMPSFQPARPCPVPCTEYALAD